MTHVCRTPALVLFIWLALTGVSPAQEASVPFPLDTHAFRHTIGRAGLKPVAKAEDLGDPQESVIVLLGKFEVPGSLPLDKPLAEFVRKGAALLFASDQPQRVGDFGIEVVGGLIFENLGPDQVYRGELADCPLVKFNSRNHPLIRGLEQPVATNRPAKLVASRNGNRLATLAHIAATERYFPRGTNITFTQTGLVPFAIGGDYGNGRVLFLADHSIFLNDMMLQTDNGNLAFAANCLEWLCDGKQRRTQVLYVEDGVVRTDLEIKWKEVTPREPTIEDLVRIGDQLLADWEDEDFFNRMLLNRFDHNFVIHLAVVLLTLALGVFLWLRLLRQRHRIDASAPVLAKSLMQLAPVGNVLEQRHKAQLDTGNYGAAGQELARQFFDDVLPAGTAANAKPVVSVHGSWWKRLALGRTVSKIWRMAQGEDVGVLTAWQLLKLNQQLDEVRTAVASGALTIGSATGDRI